MGVYRSVNFTSAGGKPISLEYAQGEDVTIHVSEPGLEYTAVIPASAWVETRTDCFCCSCGDFAPSDPACRNHGFAAKRPCEVHNMPGEPWDREYDGNYIGPEPMPESVQAVRARSRQTAGGYV